jgi:hypothetical protein
MINPKRFDRTSWLFGKLNQQSLQPFLESYLGEPIIETTLIYDTVDGKTPTKDIEIKTRGITYDWNSSFLKREGWLLPACKVQTARDSGRPFHCFYYWKKDNSVWEWVYNEEQMERLVPFVPSFHKDKQLHYNIPFLYWKKIT